MVQLGVNIDHVATLRQARGTEYPDPIQAALIAQDAGADLITLHLREDRRHIQDRDVSLIKEVLQVPMNLEMAITEEMLGIAEKIKPEKVCLVPEKRQELTTEGGLDVVSQQQQVQKACLRLRQAGCEVSLFIDADPKQIQAAKDCQAPVIEIHTGHYAEAKNEAEQQQQLSRLIEAVHFANSLDLIVNAGHGLHYHNVQAVAEIAGLRELNIGHAIIARAVFVGLATAIAEMKQLLA